LSAAGRPQAYRAPPNDTTEHARWARHAQRPPAQDVCSSSEVGRSESNRDRRDRPIWSSPPGSDDAGRSVLAQRRSSPSPRGTAAVVAVRQKSLAAFPTLLASRVARWVANGTHRGAAHCRPDAISSTDRLHDRRALCGSDRPRLRCIRLWTTFLRRASVAEAGSTVPTMTGSQAVRNR